VNNFWSQPKWNKLRLSVQQRRRERWCSGKHRTRKAKCSMQVCKKIEQHKLYFSLLWKMFIESKNYFFHFHSARPFDENNITITSVWSKCSISRVLFSKCALVSSERGIICVLWECANGKKEYRHCTERGLFQFVWCNFSAWFPSSSISDRTAIFFPFDTHGLAVLLTPQVWNRICIVCIIQDGYFLHPAEFASFWWLTGMNQDHFWMFARGTFKRNASTAAAARAFCALCSRAPPTVISNPFWARGFTRRSAWAFTLYDSTVPLMDARPRRKSVAYCFFLTSLLEAQGFLSSILTKGSTVMLCQPIKEFTFCIGDAFYRAEEFQMLITNVGD